MEDMDYRQLSTGRQVFYLFLIWIGCMIIGAAVSLGLVALLYGRDMANDVLYVTHTTNPGFLTAFRIFLGLGNTLLAFLLPACIFSYWVVNEPDEYIGARNYFPYILLLVAAIFMVLFLPVIDITSYFNQKMTLPPSMKGLEQWIRDTEAAAAQTFKVILDMKTSWDFIITLLLVAVFPAISEEFFFRGCLQTIFQRMTRNTHAAVWITAFIFSFIHFEFLGFVPRLLLGAALGYFYAWSGSIWPSVIVHFINNGASVLILYLYQHKVITADPDNGQPMFSQMWIYALSIAASVGIMLLYRKICVNHEVLVTDGEELD